MHAAEEPSKPTPTEAPLLLIGPASYENTKGEPFDLVVTLSTIMVEPTYLQ